VVNSVIICDNLIFELQALGGVSKYWAKTIERLDKTQLNISFLEGSRAHKNVFRRALQLEHQINFEPGPVVLRRLRRVRAISNVFHSSYYRISRNSRFNIVTIHDFMNELFPSSFRDIILAKLKRRACSCADRIVVVSEHTRQDLLRHYPEVDPGKVQVLYNGADDEFFPEVLNAPFEIEGELIEPRSYFLYVGTRGYCKNFPYAMRFLAAAHAQGMRHRLVVVGGGPFSRIEMAQSAKLGVPDGALVQLSGVGNESLRQLYSNAVALLMPSRYEGFGLPALEAARCGALVLASRGSALEEVVGETDYSLDLNREREIERVLSMGFDNTAANAERSRVLLHSARFSWDRSVQQLADIYEDYDRR